MSVRAVRPSGLIVAGGLLLTLGLGGCSPQATRDDSGPAQDRRAHTVERLLVGDLYVEGPGYTVLSYEPLEVFFQTWSGSKFAYCGYEYAAGSSVEPRLEDGRYDVIEEIGEGWFWVCGD